MLVLPLALEKPGSNNSCGQEIKIILLLLLNTIHHHMKLRIVLMSVIIFAFEHVFHQNTDFPVW